MKAKLLTMALILMCAFIIIIYAVGTGILALLLSRFAEAFGWLFMLVASLVFGWVLINTIFGIEFEEEKEGESNETIRK